MLHPKARSTMRLLTLRIVPILERKIIMTMTIEQVVLMNGAYYLWSFGLLGLLALAWARLERERSDS